jgi:hypothetical protein
MCNLNLFYVLVLDKTDVPGHCINHLVSMLYAFLSLLLMTWPNKLECLYLAINFQSRLTFAGKTRSVPKKEASERSSNWVCWPCPQMLRPDQKGFPRAIPLAYWASLSVTKGKKFYNIDTLLLCYVLATC